MASLSPGERLVEVAIDAAGASGARTYTYAVPAALSDLVPGEAVLVEYGRRQALGVVIAEASARPAAGVKVKPILERVRADGPLLPGLSLELARWIADHYLAPAAFVLRAMLPPGMLERLELVAEARPAAIGSVARTGSLAVPAADQALLEQLRDGPRAARDFAAPEGRAGLLRRLRDLANRGVIDLDWTLTSAAAGPRYERWAWATDEGRAAAAMIAADGRPAGRPLGPRQQALLAELAEERSGLSGSELGGRHGTAALASLVRRGMVEVEVRERPRRPLGNRAAGRRGSRPEASSLTAPQAEAVGLIRTALAGRDSTPLLLDGVTGGGKTAVYVEAIAAALELGRPVLLLVPEIALALPIVDRLRADLDARIALLHSGLGEGERADEWRRVRAGAVDVVVGTRLAVLAPFAELGLVIVDEEHEGTYKSDRTPRLQARDSAIRLAELAGAAVVLGSATPAVDTVGRVRAGAWRRVVLPSRPSGAPPVIDVVDLRAELAAGNRGLLSDALAEALAGLDTAGGERAILVINRRGSASVVMCRDCGSVQACPECERPLVFHQAGMSLRCHHCGTASPLATRCPTCGSARIRYLGGGTERVEREVRNRFRALRVGRLDRDVVERKGAAERLIDAFTDGRLDVL
ncbi:MAG TPA: primosomal protein N', partial [Candidatus Limnocylindrales bacterium]